MKKSSRFEKDKNIGNNMVKDVRNLFRLKEEINATTIKDKRNLFRPNKKLNQSKTEYLEILGMKKKNIIINQ